jgi:hypothetical protein
MGIVGATVFGARVVLVDNDCMVVLYDNGSAVVAMDFFNNSGRRRRSRGSGHRGRAVSDGRGRLLATCEQQG